MLAEIEALTDVLLYHVVDGKVMSIDVADLTMEETLEGSTLDVAFDGETVKVNDAVVVLPNIEAYNGVIHVIDAVLLPEATQ